MNAERLRVLEMIQEGQITAAEGASLLDALDASQHAGTTPSAGRSVRITVSDLASGQVRASVSVPFTLVDVLARAGTRLSKFWSPHLGDLDIAAVLEAARTGIPGKVADVADQDSGKRWEIFVE